MRHLLFLVLIILAEVIYCQEPFPLKLGNSWATRDFFFRPNYKRTVIDTGIIMNGENYFKIQSLNAGVPITEFIYYSRLREDGYYINFDSVNFFEKIYFKENPKIGDSWVNENPSVLNDYFTIVDTGYYLIFGGSTKIFIISVTDSILNYNEQYWSLDYGLIQYTVEDPFAGNLYWLSGCVIDGVVHGDTSLNPVSVDDNEPPPEEYFLKQNYPNPFNPFTFIDFYLPTRTWVQLKIYDLLGNEINELIDEEIEAGHHQVIFDGSKLSSGIYFYKLIAGRYQETKKMLLIK